MTPELIQLAKQMYALMMREKGLGLAAPQVGESIRLIVARAGLRPVYLFNPIIVKSSRDKGTSNEGCLSFPGEYVPIQRSYAIFVQYTDINNKRKSQQFYGLQARAVIHEIEHLDGINLVDHNEDLRKKYEEKA